MDQDETINDLRREVAGLRFGLFLLVTAVLIALALWNLFTIYNIPRMEKIFEDMLGSREKLPELTKLILSYGRAGAGLLPVAVIGSFTLIAWSLMLLMRNSWKFFLAGGIAALFLMAHGLIIGGALFLPLIVTIQGINGHP